LSDCIFCSGNFDLIYEDELVFAMYDTYPVSKGHVLIIPKDHIATFFDASFEMRVAIDKALFYLKVTLDKKFKPDGYNIGINNGEASGQTIFHLHVHLIPRYLGDVEDPTGGVRGVIPSKQKY